MYIFDTSSFIEMSHFYPRIFPTLWEDFNSLVRRGEVLSVKEVFRELEGRDDTITGWARSNREIFLEPSSEEEALFITEIFSINHFQHMLEKAKLIKGGDWADPFVIASAKIRNATVVTEEKHRPNGAKIPNVCDHFHINCVNLEGFMESENWRF